MVTLCQSCVCLRHGQHPSVACLSSSPDAQKRDCCFGRKNIFHSAPKAANNKAATELLNDLIESQSGRPVWVSCDLGKGSSDRSSPKTASCVLSMKVRHFCFATVWPLWFWKTGWQKIAKSKWPKKKKITSRIPERVYLHPSKPISQLWESAKIVKWTLYSVLLDAEKSENMPNHANFRHHDFCEHFLGENSQQLKRKRSR